jgi:serine protease
MRVRLLEVFAPAVALVAVVTISAQQQPPDRPGGSKERLNDIPTPGVLGGLAVERTPTLSPDTTGMSITLPERWEVDRNSGAAYRRGEVLVRFRDGVGANTRTLVLQATRTRRILRVLPANWVLAEVDPATPIDQTVTALRRRPEVAEVALNYRVTTQQSPPNDEFFRLQWNFEAIQLVPAWQINPGARNDVTVAVIDTGLNLVTDTILFASPFVGQIPVRFAEVPDLVTSERIVNAHDFVYDDDLPVDLGGHGTHVAGTIAQQTNNNLGVAGVAYNVKLMPLKVLSGGSLTSWDEVFNPGNPSGTSAIIADAIRFAADNGAKVINLSLGAVGQLPTVRDAISYAVSHGAFVAIAAGNSAEEGNPREFPAAYAPDINGAMAVGAVDRNLRRAEYSSFHPYVEICAPGGSMDSAFDFDGGITQVGYEEVSTLSFLTFLQKVAAVRQGFRPRFDRFELRPFQGTSMATPHVSGVAALLYSQGITNPAAIEEAIKRFARPIDATADECGAGLVDARRALRGLGLAR